MKIPKQWVLISLYMVFIYCVVLGLMQYAKYHPITDAAPVSKQSLGQVP